MAYGSLKVDNIIFTNGGVDQTITVSGIVSSTSGDLTVTGTISGATIQGGTLVSGATVTGDIGQFTTLTGETAGFTTLTGATVTGTTANFVTVSGTTVTGNTAQFTTLTGNTAGFTTLTGATVTGTTANFATISGTTITGGHVTTTSGTFTGNSTAAAFVPTGSTVPTNGVYLPSANNVAISTNGTGRLFVGSDGSVGVGGGNLATVPVLVQDTGNGVVIQNAASGNYAIGLLAGAGSQDAYVYQRTNAPLIFGTNNTERVRLTAAGLLGLGTSSPRTVIDVNGIATIRSGANGEGGINLDYSSNGDSRNWLVRNDALAFGDFAIQQSTTRTGNTYSTRLCISPTGNVGIGTTAPEARLHVLGGTTSGAVNVAAVFTGGVTSTTGSGARIYLSGSPAVATIRAAYIEAVNEDGGNNTHSLRFATNANQADPVERMRIDNAGRLLVGTSTARSNIAGITPQSQIEGTSFSTSSFSLTLNSNDSQSPYLEFAKTRATSIGGVTVVQNNDQLGYIGFAGADGNDVNQNAAAIAAYVDGTPGADDMPGRLVFSTTADGASSPTERMRIQANGRTRFFSADEGNESYTAQGAGTSISIYAGGYSRSTINSGGTTSYYVWSNGNVQNTNNSYTGISDIKLKENIVGANSQWNDLKALQVRNYNFKEETGQQTHTQIGLIAQEVELVSPGLVTESPDRDEEGNDLGTATKSVNYSVLYMKAVKALQEAMERIETLEAKVAALEGV
jgi:hypothetical protein